MTPAAGATLETDRLLDLLAAQESAGDVCAWGDLTMVLPGLEVEGVGPVTFPILPAQARKLIGVASQAPYGRGQETVVDTRVRRVWQLEPHQFTLRNPAWAEAEEAAVEAVREAFDLTGEVEAHLYKLLVYEKGSFFVAHRDTEKADGMFATMVLCLPSAHTGGVLEVTHDRESWEMDLAPGSEFGLQYAAFYADCLHEVKPVESGYRVCLVYNLTRPRGRGEAPRPGSQVEPVAEALAEVLRTRDKVALPLEHEYTESGIGWDDLKGRDRTLLHVLQGAAERLDLDLHLALLTLEQSGEANLGDFSRYERHRLSEDEVGMDEVYEESFTLDSWRDEDGPVERLGRMKVLPEEVLLRGGLENLPWAQEVHEATGNEGVTVERTYRGAMAVLWPRGRFLALLAREGPGAAVPMLEERAGQEALDFAEAILDAWPPGRDKAAASMLEALARLGDADLARRFVGEVLPLALLGSEGEPLDRLCEAVGWPEITPDLEDLVATQEPGRGGSLERTVRVLSDLDGMPAETARALGPELLRVLRLWDQHGRGRIQADRKPTLKSIFRILHRAGEPDLLQDLVSHCLADEELYPVREVLAPVTFAVAELGGEAWRRLCFRCLERLREWTSRPVLVPSHWRQDVKLPCSCSDCRDLAAFMADPKETVWLFRAVQDRRSHLEHTCRAERLDVDLRTEKSGSPHTLVLTKNRASYERAQERYVADRRVLGRLKRLVGRGSAGGGRGRTPSKPSSRR